MYVITTLIDARIDDTPCILMQDNGACFVHLSIDISVCVRAREAQRLAEVFMEAERMLTEGGAA